MLKLIIIFKDLENEVKRITKKFEELNYQHEKVTETKVQIERENQLLNG